MKKAVFIDRDGIINQMTYIDGKFDSPKKVSQVKLVKGVAEVIAWLNKKRIPVVEVTNQPDVALEKYDLKTLEEIEKKIHYLLNKKAAKVNKIYRCLHHPKSHYSDLNIDCDCRKPKSGMLIQAAKELDIDLKKSVVIGDNATDMEVGRNMGCKTVLFFHENDIQEKVNINKRYQADYKVYSHKQVKEVIIQLFK